MFRQESHLTDQIGQPIAPGDIVVTQGYSKPQFRKVTKIRGTRIGLNGSAGGSDPKRVLVANKLAIDFPEISNDLSQYTVDYKIDQPRNKIQFKIEARSSYWDDQDIDIVCLVYKDGVEIEPHPDTKSFLRNSICLQRGKLECRKWYPGQYLSGKRVKEILGYVPGKTTIVDKNLTPNEVTKWLEDRGIST